MLMRTEPLRELDRFTRDMWGPEGRPVAMPITAYRQDDALVVHVDLPGVRPESIDATLERNVLTIRAERSSPVPEDAEHLVGERSYGAFTRQLFLGATLAVDDVTAGYDAGVLTLTIPLADQARSRKIEVTSAEEVSELTP